MLRCRCREANKFRVPSLGISAYILGLRGRGGRPRRQGQTPPHRSAENMSAMLAPQGLGSSPAATTTTTTPPPFSGCVTANRGAQAASGDPQAGSDSVEAATKETAPAPKHKIVGSRSHITTLN